MQVSVQITERHVYTDVGRFKFFGMMIVDGSSDCASSGAVAVDQFPNMFTGEPDYRVRYDGGETIVRPELKAAVLDACKAFAARVAE
jgi:hypothetical protein